MLKERILEILTDWNFWEKDQASGVFRDSYLDKLNRLRNSHILAIVGARRAGKSTLMRQYIRRLFLAGVPKKDTLFVNLEEARFAGSLSLGLLQDIYETFLQYLQPSKKPYIFLDEVQNIPQWERFVRSLQERDEANIIVSGSNSKLLSAEFGTLLTGRYLLAEVFPLSFKEFLTFKGIPIEDRLHLIQERMKIKNLLMEYIKNGGFPQVVLSEPKRELLETYFNDTINRDVVRRFKIRNIQALQALANYYLTSISSLITFNKIRNFLNIPLDTVERFSYYLEYAYLIFFVKRLSFSLKEREKSPRKVYGVDTGLRNAVGFSLSEDYGRNLENIVFLELKKRDNEIYYWKDNTGKEVDFVIKSGKEVINLIQACWDVEDIDVKRREILPLLKAMEEFGLTQAQIVTSEFEGEDEFKGRRIKFIPLWKWLLE